MHGSTNKWWTLEGQLLRHVAAWITHPSYARSRLKARWRNGQPLTRRVSARMRFERSALVNGSWSCDDMCSPPTLTRSGFDWIEGADLEQWFSKEEE